jgi:hypothetical protein
MVSPPDKGKATLLPEQDARKTAVAIMKEKLICLIFISY